MKGEQACREIEDLLALRPEDRTAEERRRVRAHLERCPACTALAVTYAEQDRLIRSLPQVTLTQAQRDQLHTRIEHERRGHSMRLRLATVLGTMAAVAALVILAFALNGLLRQNAQPAAGLPTAPGETAAPPAAQPLVFAGEIAYTGGEIDPSTWIVESSPLGGLAVSNPYPPGSLFPEAHVTFHLTWKVVPPPRVAWVVAAHLLNQAGELVAQNDAAVEWPQQPCTQGGDQACAVDSIHEWALPAGLPPGTYRVAVALYDPATGMRAPVTSPPGMDAPVVLGEVEVVTPQATASLGTFSGRENPTWSLADEALGSLREILEDLSLAEEALDTTAEGMPPYYGFTVELDGSLMAGAHYIEAYNGVVVLRDENRDEVARLADPDYQIERFLFESATGVDTEVYEAALARFTELTGLSEEDIRPETSLDDMRAALEAYQPGDTTGIASLVATWLSAGGDPAELETMLHSMQQLADIEPEVKLLDLNGDGLEDVGVETQWMGVPVLACLQGVQGGYACQPLPETIRDGLAVMRGDLTSQELTGDARPETVISYSFLGGSSSHELLYVYRWDDAGQPQLIFNAALTTWAGTSTWELAPDGIQPGAQQIVLTYPYLFGDGFDHKMLNHPLARQIWRWDGGAGRFTLADETVRGPEMSWGPQPDETTEDRLRWTVNEGEQAFRAGNYMAALEQAERVLSIAQATGWSPEEGQPDWAGYARFRQAETLALLGRSDEATQEMQAVAEAYSEDMLGELAAAFMSGYAGGDPAAGVGAMQALGADLYNHFYYERAGALRFPMDAHGILYPGAGLAAYLDAHPELAGDGGVLAAGLQEAGFDAVDAVWGDGEVRVVLRLPDAPNAEGASVLWRLARSGDGWYVMPVEPDPLAPGWLSEPGWPTVGGFPAARYAPQPVESAGEPPVQETPDEAGAALTHVVQSGDTLVSIAARYGISVDTLMAANNLQESSQLRVGDTLIIPHEGQRIPSPTGDWVALLDEIAGSLDLRDPSGGVASLFPPGSSVTSVSWSPDGRHLLAVRGGTGGATPPVPAEIWGVDVDGGVGAPHLLFQAEPGDSGEGASAPPGQIAIGAWSPDGRRVTFWQGMLGASVQADGLPLAVLDVETGEATPLGFSTLLHPGYQSWAPDGSALAISAGGYRSAQVNKWLAVYQVETGQVTTVVSATEQVPGILAWSPRGDRIAYAAVAADETGPEWADWMVFDNPAIAARRIYLLDPATGEHWRLNDAQVFQDAPVWSEDGGTLYYVQRDGDQVRLMAADPASGAAQPVPGAAQPLPEMPGYYGQGEWEELLGQRSALQPQPTPTPRPTAPPAPQPTAPPMATPAPTPEGDATPEAQIQSFRVTPDRVRAGETIEVSWEISGDAEYALLQLTDTGAVSTGQINFFDYAPPSGTRRIPVPVETRGDIRVSLSAVRFPPATGSGPRMPAHLDSAEQIVAFDDPDPGVGQVQAAFQQFQSGFMIWRADIGTVLAFVQADLANGYDGTYSQYPEELYAGWPDFTGDVPEGFLRPAHAFGKVWRQDDAGALPALLGYPTAAEQGYTMTVRKSDAHLTYTLPDGRSATVDEGGAYWRMDG